MDVTAGKSGCSSKMAYVAACVIQLLYAGMFLLSKAAFDGGMNNFIFVFYRQAAASIFLFPITLFFGWKSAPPLSLLTFCKIFMLSFIGITLSLNIYGIGLIYTSATLAAASANSLPVITFILAVLLRTESVNLRTHSGLGKVAGILICTGGVATLAFYKGPNFSLISHGSLHTSAPQTHEQASHSMITWVKGCFFMLMSNILWALWLILQGKVLKNYPSKLLFTTLQCFLSAFQSFFIAIAAERDPQEWRLGWNVRLLAVAYCGIAVTGVCYYLQTFVIEKKGPVFLSLTTPLSLIITTVGSVLLLGLAVSLGSIVGGLLLVAGLYSVLWGKSRECSAVANMEKEGSSHVESIEVVVIDLNRKELQF